MMGNAFQFVVSSFTPISQKQMGLPLKKALEPSIVCCQVVHARALNVRPGVEWKSFHPMITLHDHITIKEHKAVLQEQVHHMSQTWFDHDAAIFNMIMTSYAHAKCQ